MSKEKVSVAAMRMLTEWTGGVTENQLKTLNMWPAVMVKDLKSHRIALNLDEKKVTFHLTMKPKKKITDLRISTMLERGVWSLLGDGWSIVIKEGRRILYAGPARVQETVPNGRDSFGQGSAAFDSQRARNVP